MTGSVLSDAGSDSGSDGDSSTQIKIVEFPIKGQTADTRFSLFGEMEIHAHSSVLKAQSRFFKTFMDSPDKVPAEAGAEFTYEWVSQIDEDGKDWHVVAASNWVCLYTQV